MSWQFTEKINTTNYIKDESTQATVQVRLRYDEELGQYLDDGSTYSYGSTIHQESYSPSNNVKSIGDASESGSGSIAGKGGSIAGYIEDGAPRMFGLGITLSYLATGTTTQTPGGTETSTWTGAAQLTCEDIHDLLGKETTTGTFDMTCTLTISQSGVNATTTVTGVLTVYG
jgi:hypothetical protein